MFRSYFNLKESDEDKNSEIDGFDYEDNRKSPSTRDRNGGVKGLDNLFNA